MEQIKTIIKLCVTLLITGLVIVFLGVIILPVLLIGLILFGGRIWYLRKNFKKMHRHMNKACSEKKVTAEKEIIDVEYTEL